MSPELMDLLGGSKPVAAAGGVAYDGSSVTENMAWYPALRSADADILPEKATLDARSRDTMRNDGYVAGGAAVHKDNIVGAHFLLNAKPETKVLWGREDEKWETEFQEEVETKFHLWANSDQNWVDASRHNNLTEMVRLAVGVYVAGGEVLAAAEWMRNRPFGTAIQMIDTDRLSTPMSRIGQPEIRNGVERNAYGEAVAYHIQVQHPSDYARSITALTDPWRWKRVPARKPWGRQMILHIFEQMRPDQTRGVAAMVTALTEMRMTKAFRKTELERAVVAATYAASIESDLPSGDAYAAMGGGDVATSIDWVEQYYNLLTEFSGGAKNLHIAGSKIPVFAPGTKLKIQNPGANGPMGDKFEQSLLRYIAAALGISYEQLSKDYSQTNYSSARAAMSETWRTMQSRKKIVADRFAGWVYRLWMEEAVNYGLLDTLKRPKVPSFYDGLNAEAYCACEWIGAGQGLIDPLKETQADILALKGGLTTKETVIARRSGGDWRKTQRQIKRELAADRDLGLPSVYEQDTQQMENSLTGEKNQ